ncbi:MAG: ParA family protein [Gammaproteobacteria bacterium]|nr:ParA family protein [Gammaproteobacteria bacterium]
MKQRVIAVLNQKGGVGKTTTAYNLAFAIASMRKRVLAIDLDPQSHMAVSLGLMQNNLSGIDDVILDGAEVTSYIINQREYLDLLPAGFRLSEVEKLSIKSRQQAIIIRDALAAIKGRYDYIILDCPPMSGLLNFNALFASDEVIVPVSSDYLALHGLSQLMKTLKSTQRFMQKPMKTWIALTRFGTRRRLSREVLARVMHYFPKQVLATPIRECAPVAESPSFGLSVLEYDAQCNGAKDYRSLADDIINCRTFKA